MKHFFSTALPQAVIILLLVVPARSQLITDDSDLQFPASGLWNGFNEHLNVLECSNYAGQDAGLGLELRQYDGSSLLQTIFAVPGFGTVHIPFDSFGTENSYGSYTLTLLSGSESLGGNVRCVTAIYRFSASGATKVVDYAFALPVLNPVSGTTAGIFNSINPDGSSTPTYNWLSLFNSSAAAFSGTIEVYDQGGNQLRTQRIESLAQYRRIDIALGHEESLSNGQIVGIYRVVPDNLGAEYSAFLTRYLARGASFAFAFPTYASKGGCDGEPMFASSMNPANNWAEIANISNAPADITIEIRDRFGALANTLTDRILPFQQKHIFLNPYIGAGLPNVGSFRVQCLLPMQNLLIQSAYYGRLDNNAVQTEWAYALQQREILVPVGKRLAVPVNTFLGMYNWFKLLDADYAQANTTVEFFDPLSTEIARQALTQFPGTAADIYMNSFIGFDQVGTAVAGSETSGVQLSGDVLRVFGDASGGIGYIFNMPPSVIDGAVPNIRLSQIASGLTNPVALANAGDSTNRLFIVEQTGRIKIFDGATVLGTAFLDITDRVNFGGERGLLSVAFHPNYQANRKFYVNYTRADGATVVSEFLATIGDANLADAASERVIIVIPQPYANHNGGQLQFSPNDGFLYIGMGDGGSANDPEDNGQDISTLLGAMLRIDIDGVDVGAGTEYRIPADNPFVGIVAGNPREEIWAYGFRNPWRFSFDSTTGRLFAGDVGQNAIEEIDLVEKGKNYGWNIMEGSRCFNPATGCDQTGLELPIFEYDHSAGTAVVGGYVYRGSAIPALVGKYLLADFSSSKIWALEERSDGTWLSREMLEPGFLISSFGEDENGELYVVSISGTIHRIIP